MKQLLRAIGLLLILGLVATSIFAGGTKESAEMEGEDGPTTIIYYLWDDPTYARIVEAFNESQDEIFVDAQYIPAGDYEAKLTTLLSGGAEMDAFMQKRQADRFPHYASGYIEPLEDLVAKHDYDFDMVSAYEDILKVDGRLLAIPFRGASHYTYFNKRVFAEAGLPTPETYVEKGEWTWEKFEEVANDVATGDGTVYGGLLYTWGSQHYFPAFQHGVEFVNAEGEIDMHQSVIESLNMRKRLEESLAIYPLVELKVTKTHYSQAFYRGNLGMLIIGEWFPGMMISAREEGLLQGFTWDDWGVTRMPMPSDMDQYYGVGNPTFNHVHADSDKKDAAFKFISWMGGPEGAEVVAKAGFLPPLMTEEVRASLATALPDESSLKYFTETVPLRSTYQSPYGSRVEQFMARIAEDYMQGEISSANLQDEIIVGLTEIIETTN
ncbi:MAG: extracellular solute-binding protein [Alkalispirochaetaceae bacterium]